MSKAMPLTCGHQPRANRWVTVFYPNVDAPYRRFCDVECMIWWHQQMRECLLHQPQSCGCIFFEGEIVSSLSPRMGEPACLIGLRELIEAK
jgi:hypothetical protein